MAKDNKLDIVKEVEKLRNEIKQMKKDKKFLEWRINDLEIRYQISAKNFNKLKNKMRDNELLLATKVGI